MEWGKIGSGGGSECDARMIFVSNNCRLEKAEIYEERKSG